MKREELTEQVKKMLVKDLRLKMSPEEIDDDALLFGDGLGLDSLDAMELVVALEKHFKAKVASAEIGEKVLVSINTIVDFIEEYRQKNE